MGRKKAIAAVLATPVAQDANSAPDSSTGAAKQDVRAPPKVPAKKAVAKAAATGGTKPVDQDLLQVAIYSAASFALVAHPFTAQEFASEFGCVPTQVASLQRLVQVADLALWQYILYMGVVHSDTCVER